MPVLLKVFEKSLFIPMRDYFGDIFDEQQCGFRKGYNNQQCLLKTSGKCESSADKGKIFGALLTNLFKVFDCLNHELLIAERNAYAFSLPALRLIYDYLFNRKQKTGSVNS